MNLTKVLPPGTGNILLRERLINRLLGWDDKKLIILHAQAGQGKSTLAADYVRSLGYPSAWYNMDQEDDNPGLFLAGLAEAVKRAYPDRVTRLPVLSQNNCSDSSLRRSMPGWISQVFGNLPKQSMIVFDDFNDSSCPDVLLFFFKLLLETTPPHIRFMIISRTRPALEIAGLRAKRAVGEITGNDLKFNDAEVHQLFCSIFGMPLAQNQAALINRNAEGWPAGLVLMHEYLYSAVPASKVDIFGDGVQNKFQSHVFDYLAQEVFAHLPGYLQDFLLRTSVTDYLPAALIERLTGLPRVSSSSSSKSSITGIVNELQKRNLFTAILDEDGPVVRYHALFRDFLWKKTTAGSKRGEVKKLCSIASIYFNETGDIVRAIDLLLGSNQFEKAIQAIESAAPALIASGRAQTMLRWQKQAPLELRNTVWFLFSTAVACRFSDPKASLELYERSLEGFQAGPAVRHRTTGQMLSLCGLIEACFHADGGLTRMSRAAGLAQSLLREKNREPAETRARLLLAIGMAWFFLGKLDQSREALQQALELFRRKADHFYQVTSAAYLTPCALYQGDFRAADEALRKGFDALACMPDEAGSRAALLFTKAMSALFQGNFTEARECIDQCRSMADIHALESISFLSGDIEGWLKIAEGRYGEAAALLADCKRRGVEAGNHFRSASAAHLLAISYMFLNKFERAKVESDYALAVHAQSGSKLFHAIYVIASGSIHLKLGKMAKAEKELLSSLTMLQQSKAVQQEVNAHLALALLYRKKKKNEVCCRHLRAGFTLGRDLGFSYYALLTADELADLAKFAIAGNICREYCETLLDRSASGKPVPVLRVHSLGGFSVFRGKTRVQDSEWKSRRAKALLKLLVAHDGRKLPRDRAMELLWPDRDGDDLRASFNSLLHRARKVLELRAAEGRDVFCIYQEGDLIALNRDLVWTDVHQFLAHIRRAGQIKSGQIELLREYESAIELYEGDFLPEDLYADWSVEVRDRLRGQYLRVLETAGDLADSMGESVKALQFYEKMFLSDPGNEKACRWLMQRHLAGGQRTEAIRIYERCERALSRDLDLEPEEKTRKLYRSIIGG